MVISKSNFLKGAVAALAAVPVAVAGVFTSAGSAQAVSLTGNFNLFGNTAATLTLDTLTVDAPNTFNILLPTDQFAGFTSGIIGSIFDFDPDTNPNPVASTPYLTLLGGAYSGSEYFAETAIYTVDPGALAGTVAIKVETTGTFQNAVSGRLSRGQGIITLQAIGDVASVKNTLDLGGNVRATYSGLYFGAVRATTPEPTTILGLAFVGAGIAASRRRKSLAE